MCRGHHRAPAHRRARRPRACRLARVLPLLILSGRSARTRRRGAARVRCGRRPRPGSQVDRRAGGLCGGGSGRGTQGGARVPQQPHGSGGAVPGRFWVAGQPTWQPTSRRHARHPRRQWRQRGQPPWTSRSFEPGRRLPCGLRDVGGGAPAPAAPAAAAAAAHGAGARHASTTGRCVRRPVLGVDARPGSFDGNRGWGGCIVATCILAASAPRRSCRHDSRAQPHGALQVPPPRRRQRRWRQRGRRRGGRAVTLAAKPCAGRRRRGLGEGISVARAGSAGHPSREACVIVHVSRQHTPGNGNAALARPNDRDFGNLLFDGPRDFTWSSGGGGHRARGG
mmetsp:Transcript_36486/g.90975  ORF Transcript_36486/g.90975 Transcript_36486/m.90975 type:complete len:338 (-) Transcript_36486:785-1798(-)